MTRIFSPSFLLSVQVCKQAERLIGACREVIRDPGQLYEISRKEGEETQLYLVSSDYLQGFIDDQDPSLTKPLLYNVINLPVTAAAIRFEEVYRLATGDSEFPGSDLNGWPGNLDKSGFELKIHTQGTRPVTEIETVLTASDVVEVDHPVNTTETLAAEDIGGVLQVAGTGGTSAELVVQDITYDSVVAAASANNISIEYLDFTPAVHAQLVFQAVHLTAVTGGTAGNAITMATTSGAVFGAEVISVVGTAISVQIAVGQTNAAIIANLINTSGPASALVSASAVTALHTQIVQGATALSGGLAAIGLAGSEVVTVSGSAISVQMQSGVSTATQIDAALTSSAPAQALISQSITGVGSNAQVVFAQQNLEGGLDFADAMQLGQVELSDNGSSIPDGTSVNVAYETQSFTIYQLQVGKDRAAILRKDLLQYLSDNSL